MIKALNLLKVTLPVRHRAHFVLIGPSTISLNKDLFVFYMLMIWLYTCRRHADECFNTIIKIGVQIWGNIIDSIYIQYKSVRVYGSNLLLKNISVKTSGSIKSLF